MAVSNQMTCDCADCLRRREYFRNKHPVDNQQVDLKAFYVKIRELEDRIKILENKLPYDDWK